MKIKLIRKNESVARRISKTYKINNYITSELCRNVSLAIGEAKNHSEITKNINSDRIYYVLKGELTLKKDNKRFVAGPGDSIYIPKNTEYCFRGTFRAIIINSPAFKPQNEKIKQVK